MLAWGEDSMGDREGKEPARWHSGIEWEEDDSGLTFSVMQECGLLR